MRNIVELVNIENKDGTVTNIKFYLNGYHIEKYDYVNSAKFCGHMAILSTDASTLDVTQLHNLAIEALNESKDLGKYESVYILKDFNKQ